jgi:hypothetical protein
MVELNEADEVSKMNCDFEQPLTATRENVNYARYLR